MIDRLKNSSHQPLLRTSFFRFYEELNDFLEKEQRKRLFPVQYTGTPSVKNTIEAIGVPHSEVDLILVNGISVGFEYLIKGGEQVSVYPVFETLDISPITHLRPKPLRDIKFIVDVNLGKLAQKLRLLGFDSLFRNDYHDHEIIEIALLEKRIILTRDKELLKHNKVNHGYWLRNNDPKKQLNEVVERLQLQTNLRPFTRCSNCNGGLNKVTKDEIKMRIPADTYTTFNEFWKCLGCGNVYWQGSHYDRICEWVKEIRDI